LDFGPSGCLWLLFGDAWSAVQDDDGSIEPKVFKDDTALTPPYNVHRPFNADPVAIAPPNVTAETLDETFELSFFRARDGGYATLEIPGVSLLTDKVPTGAINTPGGVYIFATGKPFHVGGHASGDDPQRSWVTRWRDLTSLKTDPPCEFSQGPFANYLCPVVGGVNGTPAHPTEGKVVWLWGTTFPNRQSSVRLAYVPLEQIGDRGAWRFFAGTSRFDKPKWHADEWRAAPLPGFETRDVGEFSVAWVESLGLWLLLYNCPNPRGILCRWAQKPWGPWAPGIIVFDPRGDNGYQHFIHEPGHDMLNDPGHDYIGGEYAPIIIPRYTKVSRRTTTIRYTMSTWNPYAVVIMESELRLRGWFTFFVRRFQQALNRAVGWSR
jgi:hypothetical protein